MKNRLKEYLKIINWFFHKGRWWRITMGLFFSGLMIYILQEYILSKSLVLGILFGLIVAFIDFINGYRGAFSLMEWILEEVLVLE